MMHKLRPERPVDLLSSYEGGHLADQALGLDTSEGVLGPVSVERFQRATPDHLSSQCLIDRIGLAPDQVQEIEEELDQNLSFVAASRVMRKLHAQAELLAKLDVPILIMGESGSGKGLVGRLIHKLSNRSANRFLKVNCAAVDPDVLDRELFGRERRRSSEQTGLESTAFALCSKGTILLEDIDELPARTQAKLVCLLQDKQVFLGEENTVELDVRILATTKVNIETALSERKMHKELYYSLSAFTIVAPPLRERREEIPLLLRHFMNRIAANFGLPTRNFPPAVLRACQKYAWPGNLRELEKFVKRYVVSGEDKTPSCSGEVDNSRKTWAPGYMTEADSGGFESLSDTSASKSLLHSVREEAERNAIITALEQTGWNRTAAARLLNVSYRTLLYKIQQYGMSPQKD
jgi:DNA-binding NtrC family response regulator